MITTSQGLLIMLAGACATASVAQTLSETGVALESWDREVVPQEGSRFYWWGALPVKAGTLMLGPNRLGFWNGETVVESPVRPSRPISRVATSPFGSVALNGWPLDVVPWNDSSRMSFSEDGRYWNPLPLRIEYPTYLRPIDERPPEFHTDEFREFYVNTSAINDIVWTGTQFVAVGGIPGSAGEVYLTSPDGRHWTQHPPTPSSPPGWGVRRVIMFRGALYAAADDLINGSLQRSLDGRQWENIVALPADVDIVSGPDRILFLYRNPMVGAPGMVGWSDDGVNWRTRWDAFEIDGQAATPTNGAIWWRNAFWTMGRTADDVAIWRSADGETWEVAFVFPRDRFPRRFDGPLVLDGGLAVTNELGGLWRSTDGWNWQLTNPSSDQSVLGMVKFRDQLIAYGTNRLAPFVVARRPGENWRPIPLPSGAFPLSAAESDGRLVFFGKESFSARTRAWSSTDLVTFEESELPDEFGLSPTRRLASNGRGFISLLRATGWRSPNRVLVSSDGLNWSLESIRSPDEVHQNSWLLTAGGFYYTQDLALRSHDGVNWERTTVIGPDGQILRHSSSASIATDGMRFVAVPSPSELGEIMTSDDGLIWRAVSARAGDHPVRGSEVTWADGVWRIWGIATWESTDLISWKARGTRREWGSATGEPIRIPFDGAIYSAVGGSVWVWRPDVPAPLPVVQNASLLAGGGEGAREAVSGWVLAGGPAEVLARAVGPGLQRFGISNPAAEVRLRLFEKQQRLLAENHDWNAGPVSDLAAMARRLGAFPLRAGDRDAALVLPLAPGALTANAAAPRGGATLVESYLLSPASGAPPARMSNLSGRFHVGPGQPAGTLGFVVGGEGRRRYVIRAVGPGLAPFGIREPLPRPLLRLFDRNGAEITRNLGWNTQATADALSAYAAAAGAFALDMDGADSAILITLPPGIYTAVATSADGLPGVCLLEVYEVVGWEGLP